jgi:hypothetical protein
MSVTQDRIRNGDAKMVETKGKMKKKEYMFEKSAKQSPTMKARIPDRAEILPRMRFRPNFFSNRLTL